MSGLNTSLAYFLAIVSVSACVRLLLGRWRRRWGFLLEFLSAFSLAACRLEVDTIAEVGQWAGALGPDVAITMLFISIAVHGVTMQGVSGNPAVTLMEVLQKNLGLVWAALTVALQLLGAYLALLVAGRYWDLELTDMHMVKNLMMSECSTSLQVSPLHGGFVEALSALVFLLVTLLMRNWSRFLNIPLSALLLTLIAYAANNYTSGYVNPSLAFAMTFFCPGHSLLEYVLVYWLAPLVGMSLALFLYLGNIPLFFTRNLLFSKKSRFRQPRGKNPGDKNN